MTKFKFGNGVFFLLGSMQIRISTLNEPFLEIEVNVIPAYFPLLIDLGVLDNEKLVANNAQIQLQATSHG